jgi:hypothetical protein
MPDRRDPQNEGRIAWRTADRDLVFPFVRYLIAAGGGDKPPQLTGFLVGSRREAMLTAPEGRFVVSLIIRQFVMVGFCGGYTTFSAFSLQTQEFMQRGEWLYVSANIVSIALSLFAVWVGHESAAALNQPPAIETNECPRRP